MSGFHFGFRPPEGGAQNPVKWRYGAVANMLTWENFNELDRETAPPAKAGTPNSRNYWSFTAGLYQIQSFVCS